MKWLFGVLLAANVAFFGWHRAHPPLSEPPPGVEAVSLDPRQVNSGVALLRLDAPVPPDRGVIGNVATIAAPAGEAAPLSSHQDCRTVQLSGNDASVRAFRDLVAAGGGEILSEWVTSMTRYWVMLPSLPSNDAAQSIARTLQTEGYDDFYIVPKGENRNAISLGLFSTSTAAEQRVATYRTLGLRPAVRELTTQAVVHWFQVRTTEPLTAWESTAIEGARISIVHECAEP